MITTSRGQHASINAFKAQNTGEVVPASNAVLAERDGQVLVITLNRPDKRNAVNAAIAQGLEGAIDQLEESDELAAAIIKANGAVFCAGADLKAVGEGRGHELQTPRGGFGGIVRRHRTKPIIAAVHSDAYAGGFEIALACDMIVAASGMKMGLPEVKRSLVALAGGLVELPRLVGDKVALELALIGDPLSVERLHQLGMINRLVDADKVVATATEMARKIAANGPLAVRATRNIIVQGRDLPTDSRWEMSFKEGLPVFSSEDAREGAMAFIEKREPVWKGR